MSISVSKELITKIEGHGRLYVNWEKRKVRLEVHEGERLFEGMLVNRTAEEVHWITPRICGVCPIAHNLASLRALEDALGIFPNLTTIRLRRLMMASQMIQSHVLHLFFLASPDYLGIDNALELAEKDPKTFRMALRLKEVSDAIARTVAGRNVHPTTSTLGGFHRLPGKKDLIRLRDKLLSTSSDALGSARLFLKLKYPDYKVDMELVAQTKAKDEFYPVYNLGSILSSKNETSSVEAYKNDIQEEVRDYSTAKFGTYRGRTMMVGSLARLFHHGKKLMPKAKSLFEKHKFDFSNPFYNNPAQAVEILHFHEEAQMLIEELLGGEMDPTIAQPTAVHINNRGIGTVEAPRGGLYNEIHLNSKRIVTEANIITPTVQNLLSMEQSAQAILDQTKDAKPEKLQHLMEMLIRAYDPCITCSVH